MISDFLSKTNFGKLDPSNFGIWVNFKSLTEYDRINVNRKIPALTPLVLTTFYDGIQDEHREFVNQLPTKEDRQFALCALTLYAHETRHYHDLMSSPYGARIMRNYAKVNYFTALARTKIMFQDKSCVVPLADWIYDSELFEKIFQLPFPDKNLRHLQDWFERVTKDHENLRKGLFSWESVGIRGLDFFDSNSIIESLALLHQGKLIFMEFGDKLYKEFKELFTNERLRESYTGGIMLVNTIFGKQLSSYITSSLLHASLFRYDHNESYIKIMPPKDALIELCLWITDNNIQVEKIFETGKSIEFYQEYFCDITGKDLDEAIFKTDELNKEFHQNLLENLELIQSKYPAMNTTYVQTSIDLFEQLMAVHKGFSATVSFNLPVYHGIQYVKDQRNLTLPITFIETDGVFLTKLDNDPLEEYFFIAEEMRVELNRYVKNKEDDFISSLKTTEEGIVRIAFLLSLKNYHNGNPTKSKFFKNHFTHPHHYIELAQKNFDGNGTWLLLLMYGKDALPEIIWENLKSTMANFGTTFYTVNGVETPKVSSALEAVKENINLLSAKEKFEFSPEATAFFERIRKSKD
jgi:hypothetical protein